MTKNFYPPQPNFLLIRFAQWIVPLGARWLYQFELVVNPEELEWLRSWQQERLLLMPNHPTFQDPIVLFAFSAKLGQPFYYLAAYEVFTGSLGAVLQRLGVYSIRRGLMDRASIAQTIDLLSQPGCHLVIFPEGGCSFQNDTVMPFRVGALQLAFQTLSRIVKQGGTVPDLYVIPVSIKYRYTQDMAPVIQASLRRLQQALQITVSPQASLYEQLRTISAHVLVKVEQDYGIDSAKHEQEPWNQRIDLLRGRILSQCEAQLGIRGNLGEPVRERTYRIENALKMQAEVLETEEPKLEEAQEERAANLALIEKSVRRLLNFDAIYDGYVAENPTSERFLDTVIRLEREVFDIDKPPPKGFRQALVKLGAPINLKDAFADYQRDRAMTINKLTLQIQQAVQTNLDQLNQEDIAKSLTP